MSMYTLLRNNPNPSQELIEKALAGMMMLLMGDLLYIISFS